MQITIDTKKDSPEDIKKAIEFLQTLVSSTSASYIEKTAPPADIGSFMDQTVQKDEPDENSSVIPY